MWCVCGGGELIVRLTAGGGGLRKVKEIIPKPPPTGTDTDARAVPGGVAFEVTNGAFEFVATHARDPRPPQLSATVVSRV